MNKYKEESKKAQAAARRLRACESKRAYDTEEEAYQKGQTTYRCRYCGKWHRSGSFTTLVRTLENRASRKKVKSK